MRVRSVSTVCVLYLVSATPLWAQVRGAALSGTVTDTSGAGIPAATVSAKSVAEGRSTEAHADSGGRYNVPNLVPGDYEVSVAADGYDTKSMTVTIAAGEGNTVNVVLSRALSLEELGFSPAQTHGSALDQERLNRRSHMLKVHQQLGLITAASFLVAIVSSLNAGGRSASAGGRNLHAGLGVLTTGLYVATAYHAIFAPKISGTEVRGPIRLHKYLAWIHGPGMILTPVLGAIALDQRSRGERVLISGSTSRTTAAWSSCGNPSICTGRWR